MIIFVGNLSLNCTGETLTRAFQAFGKVLSVTILNDKYIHSGQSRAYGYVEMASQDDGSAAIAGLSGTVIDKQIIKAIEAKPLDKKTIELSSKQQNTKVRQRL